MTVSEQKELILEFIVKLYEEDYLLAKIKFAPLDDTGHRLPNMHLINPDELNLYLDDFLSSK